MKTAYIDFDGTVVDVFPRYFGILNSFLQEYYSCSIIDSFDDYKLFKREGLKDHIIVNKLMDNLEIDVNKYVLFKRENLEKQEWLEKDTIIGDIKETLDCLRKIGFRIVLLTQRNKADNLYWQLDNINIRDLFDDIYVVRPIKDGNAKFELLRNKINKYDTIIGDSPIEIEVSLQLNISGYYVDSGLWDLRRFCDEKQIFKNLDSVVKYLYDTHK